MITNERQYRIAENEARRFEDAIVAARDSEPAPDVHPRIHEATIEALESELAALREQLDLYAALKSGKVRERRVSSLRDLPVLLIEARIVGRLTQRELAERLELAEQQIQRYEATMYASANLERLQEVADALGIEIDETVTYPVQAQVDA